MAHGISNSEALAECDRKANTVMFLRSPRKEKGKRGHHPDNKYALWRSPMREARRKVGHLSARQWVRFRKFGAKAYRAFKAKQLTEGIINESDS